MQSSAKSRRAASAAAFPPPAPDSAEASLRKYYEVIDRAGNLQHQIMLRLLFYTAVRVSELVGIAVGDIDLDGCKIFIERGKGDKDRYILFPQIVTRAVPKRSAESNITAYQSKQPAKPPTTCRKEQFSVFRNSVETPAATCFVLRALWKAHPGVSQET